MIDYASCPVVFPPEILPTTEFRPDIVIYSSNLCEVLIVELTVPAEENIEKAQNRKREKYKSLLELLKRTQPKWKATLLTVECGARGFVASSFVKCLKRLGFSDGQNKKICKLVSNVVAKCSYTIWNMRNSRKWPGFNLIVEEIAY